jgi:imidazolonepropionase-like amidohydrolase
MLHRGFTSARDCGGASLALKEAINEGVFPGPRLFIAGHALTQTGGHGDTRGPHDHTECCGPVLALGRRCDGVPECIKAAREELRTGADFIKIMAGGGVASPTDKLDSVQFTSEEVRAISTVAKNANTYVTAHAYTLRSIRHAIDNGATGIEHGNFIDAETAQYMAERDIFLTPTLIAYAEMASPEFPGFLPIESETKNAEVLRAGLRSLEIASKAGVTMCYGTDLLGPLGVAQTKEFSLRSKILSAREILQSATINPARRFGLEGFLGQIKPGFAADMIILNENPLNDISIFDYPEKHTLAVIKEGRVYHSRWSKLPQDTLTSDPVIE